jgi:predicted enzyme related to lactoylglutathione lyase
MHGIKVLRFELFVSDLERASRFYERALGFVIDASHGPRSESYIQIANGSACIGLGTIASLPETHYFCPTAGRRSGVGVEIVLEVEDVKAYAERAQTVCDLFEALQLRRWGRWDFRIVDPDGYYIRVTGPKCA